MIDRATGPVGPARRAGRLLVPLVAAMLSAASARAQHADPRGSAGATSALASGAAPVAADSGGASACQAAAAERIFVPVQVSNALQIGTRDSSGAPGAAYWQQRSDYAIEVAIEPSTRFLTGRETLRYTNNSPDTLQVLVFRLYQNLFKEGAKRIDDVPNTGGLTLDSLVVGGRVLEVDEADSSDTILDGTLLAARLAEPLRPGETGEIRAAWRFTIPPDANERMGTVDSTSFFVAQWYPQIAIYDDLNGWDSQQYVGPGEFYDEYGSFDVSITVPAGFGVWATGVLQNPQQTWSAPVRERAGRAAASDAVVHVLAEDDFGPGKATLGKAGERLTWRFQAPDVRDFAFAVGDHYLWDMTGARVTKDGPRSVAASAVYRSNAPGFGDVAGFARTSLETFSTTYPGIPYPYPSMTVVEGGSGGMEYPMIVIDAAVPDRNRTLEVTAHEVGHTYFPMLVGSNETVYGWQDEGLNTFITLWPQEAMDYQPQAREEVATEVAFFAGQELEMPIMTPANTFFIEGPWYDLAAYEKPAAALLVLRDALTPAVFDRALREYALRWTNKHPSPWDFFNTIEDVAGQDLDWFWSGWFFGRGALDQGIASVESSQGTVKVVVENHGMLDAPVEVEVENERGETMRGRLPGEAWSCGTRQTVEVPLAGRVTAVTLNPGRPFPDSDPGDNRWTPVGQGD